MDRKSGREVRAGRGARRDAKSGRSDLDAWLVLGCGAHGAYTWFLRLPRLAMHEIIIASEFKKIK